MANHQGKLVNTRTNTKAVVRQACLDVLRDKDARPAEKMKAAAILERMCVAKDLAREKKRKQKLADRLKLRQKSSQDETNTSIRDILHRVSDGSSTIALHQNAAISS
jgi:hypothetical protein